MTDMSPILALPYLMPAQAQKHVTHNEALRQLDILVQMRVDRFGAQSPPALPTEGALYALGGGATGDWAGHDGDLAGWIDGGWIFVTPQEGWRAWSTDEQALRLWDGAAWVLPPIDLDNLAGVGIGTGSDATNRLAVRAPASLLTHEGAGHQLKINKATEEDTASVLLQSGWNGHAEIGLTGTNGLSIKVSPDGGSWTESLRIDPTTGYLDGAAMQAGWDDVTTGRVMTVGAFGLGSRVLKYDDTQDLDDLRGLSALIGNTSVNAVPVNAPMASGSFAGFSAAVGATRGLQMLGNTTGTSLHFRTDNNGWSKWRRIYHTDNLIGGVSQSGGIPTGAMVERGTNANGQYVRFADGTQVCWRTPFSTLTAAAADWTFPVGFSETPAVVATPITGAMPRFATVSTPQVSSVSVYLWDAGGAQVAGTVCLTATGRWF